MSKICLLQMVNGHVKNIDFNNMILFSRKYKRNTHFQHFVKTNRKELRLSLRSFQKKYVHFLIYVSNLPSKKYLVHTYKGNIRPILNKHKYLIFWLIYLKFGTNKISLSFIKTYLNSILTKKFNNCSDDSDDEEKLIFLLLLKFKIYVIKFEGISDSTQQKFRNNEDGSELKSAIIHEAHMYNEIQKIIPHSTIHCAYYGNFINKTGIMHFWGNNHTDNIHDLSISKNDKAYLGKVLKFNMQNNDEEYCFLVTNFIPGYSTYLGQLPYLHSKSIHKIFVTLMQNLFELHKHRIYHSDLHLNNLLCDISGNIKLFDYDLSSCLPNLDSRILMDYEFNYRCIINTLQYFQITVSVDKILQYMDYYYAIFIIDMYKHISSLELNNLSFFSYKNIYERAEIIEKLLFNYCRSKKKKISEFTHRALMAVMIFHEPSEYSGNGGIHTISSISSSDESSYGDSDSDDQISDSAVSFETCSNNSE